MARMRSGDAFAVPMPDGRFALVLVLQVKESIPQVALMDWVGDHPPLLPMTPRPAVLEYARPLGGEIKIVIDVVGKRPDDLKYLGTMELTEEERKLETQTGSAWYFFGSTALREWRLRHDLAALTEEDRHDRIRSEKAWAEQVKAREEHLATVTLEQLLEEKPFPEWETIPSPELAGEVEILYRETVAELIKLGPWASLENKVAVFRQFIEALNDLEREYSFIETDEREDIMTRFEEIAHAAGIPQVIDLASEWRRNW